MTLISEHIDCQQYNTLAVPAVARYFSIANTLSELHAILMTAQKNQWPLLVIGSGSNLVLPDFFNGLVLKINLYDKLIENETESIVTVSLAAGENWHKIVMWTVENNWYGLENLALIPGTVGAAPIQNIGAYGVELESCFSYLEAIEIATGRLRRFSKVECQFDYRESIFKRVLKGQYIIVRVVLDLSKKYKVNLDYPALRYVIGNDVNNSPTAKKIAEAVIAIRQSKLPDPAVLPNAGSFFKNPIISKKDYLQLQKNFPECVAYKVDEQRFKVAAGWLIEQNGWKGKQRNDIAMHEQQALVLTNPRHRSSQAILAFAAKVQDSIRQTFNIDLEIEPNVVESP